MNDPNNALNLILTALIFGVIFGLFLARTVRKAKERGAVLAIEINSATKHVNLRFARPKRDSLRLKRKDATAIVPLDETYIFTGDNGQRIAIVDSVKGRAMKINTTATPEPGHEALEPMNGYQGASWLNARWKEQWDESRGGWSTKAVLWVVLIITGLSLILSFLSFQALKATGHR